MWVFNREHYDVVNLYWSIITASKEFEKSWETFDYFELAIRETNIAWNSPEIGWMKLNVDRSSKRDGRTVGCGGVLRDSSG